MEEKIRKLVELFKAADSNLHRKSVDEYMKQLLKAFTDVRPEAINYGIYQCMERELYKTKSVAYFQAIVLNQDKQMKAEEKLEEIKLGKMPKEYRY